MILRSLLIGLCAFASIAKAEVSIEGNYIERKSGTRCAVKGIGDNYVNFGCNGSYNTGKVVGDTLWILGHACGRNGTATISGSPGKHIIRFNSGNCEGTFWRQIEE